MARTLISIFFLITITTLSAQNNDKLKRQIETDVSFLRNMIPQEEFKRNPNFEDELELRTKRAANNLVKYLKTEDSKNLVPNEIGLLEDMIRTDDKRNIRIYNFTHDSGGTRGMITYPVIQWTNDEGKLFAYNFSKKINCLFEEIYPLDDDFYLLIGYEKGSGACRQSMVYVIQFKEDYLLLEYPAFVDRPYLNFCNVKYTFDKKNKVLTGTLDENPISDINFNEQYEYPKDDKTINKLYDLLSVNVDKKEFKIRFQNKKFKATKKNEKDRYIRIQDGVRIID